jgi:hypothetical protein
MSAYPTRPGAPRRPRRALVGVCAALPTALAALLIGACGEKGAAPDMPTAPVEAPTLAVSAAASSAAADLPVSSANASSLCASYDRRLADERAALRARPHDKTVQENVATLGAVIADACR